MMDSAQALKLADTIRQGFDRHYVLFSKITHGALTRFEQADWQGDDRARRERIDYYDTRVKETLATLRDNFDLEHPEKGLWIEVKLQYMGLLYAHKQPELAESFYNSVFCQLFERHYYNNRHIFVRPGLSTDVIDMEHPAYCSYYPKRVELIVTLNKILKNLPFKLDWQDYDRDITLLVDAFDALLEGPKLSSDCHQIQIINALFYRNKAAYIVGRTLVDGQIFGFVIPVLQDDQKNLYVDTLVADAQQLAVLFSFTRAYFMVDTDVPSALIDFLQSILPSKTKSDLYTAIGFQKQGKTLFYRDFLNHLAHSSDQFILAPGIEGMVMSVFTLPSFPYVFKVIKDKFAAPKKVTRQQVKDQYLYVKMHDRIGRMADTLEFSHVAFPLKRVSDELLEKLKVDINHSLVIENDQIIIRHLYIERRMIPLNIYLSEVGEDKLPRIVKEYGNAIKDLIKANIFPGDMLLKNFGVTRQNRVIFYDYDEITPLEVIRVRQMPLARTPEQEMAVEPWYRVEENDFFPEQFSHFVLSHPRVHALFLEYHADLLEPEYWQSILDKIKQGKRADVFPYPQSVRFSKQHSIAQ